MGVVLVGFIVVGLPFVRSAVVALGYLLSGTVLSLGPLAVLGYMLWEMGVF